MEQLNLIKGSVCGKLIYNNYFEIFGFSVSEYHEVYISFSYFIQ